MTQTFHFSSLLIVYEGDDSEIPNVSIVDDSCCGPSCYDADVSNNSADYNLSHDEHDDDACNTSCTNATTVSSHQRGFAEAAARGAAKTPFIPISEDTVFLEPEPLVSSTMSTLHPENSSPHSMDSWLNYSSTSSEEYSYSGQNVDEATIDFERDLQKAAKINKRNHEHLDIRACDVPTDGTEEDEHNVDEELEPVNSITTTPNSTKRAKGKEQKMSSKTPPLSASRRSSYNRRSSNVLADIRMIDFAHTTFVVQNGGVSFGTTNKKVSYLFIVSFSGHINKVFLLTDSSRTG